VSFYGYDHPKVVSYADVVSGRVTVGKRVAIVGAGGIGFDVAELLSHAGTSPALDKAAWFREWGVDASVATRGGVEGVKPAPEASPRQIYLLQRKDEALGKNLGKTSGWVHRAALKHKDVRMISGVHYDHVDDDGLHLRVKGTSRLLEVDHVVICAGQEPQRALYTELSEYLPVHLVGGADVALELDAKRAIRQATELALRI